MPGDLVTRVPGGRAKGSVPKSPASDPPLTAAPLFMVLKQGCPHFFDMAHQKQAISPYFSAEAFSAVGGGQRGCA